MIWFVISIIGLVTIFFWFDNRRNGKYSWATNKIATWAAIITFFSFMFGLGTTIGRDDSSTSQNQSSQSSSSNSESSVSSESEPSTDDERMADLSSNKLTKYNLGLDQMLTEDQKEYSQGTDDYAWSVFVSKIQYNQNTGLTMYVNSDFSALNKAQRKVVGNRAQSLAKAQMAMMDLPITEDADVMYLNIHDEANDRIGHSSAWDQSNFKWSDL